jgi:oxygen-independent coproporphyrinogen III oxidase
VDVLARFSAPIARLRELGFLSLDDEWLCLSRDGLLQADRLVHEFFLPEHREARYA